MGKQPRLARDALLGEEDDAPLTVREGKLGEHVALAGSGPHLLELHQRRRPLAVEVAKHAPATRLLGAGSPMWRVHRMMYVGRGGAAGGGAAVATLCYTRA